MINVYGKLKDYKKFVIIGDRDYTGNLMSIEYERQEISNYAFDIIIMIYNNIELNEKEQNFLNNYNLEYNIKLEPQKALASLLSQIKEVAMQKSQEIYSDLYFRSSHASYESKQYYRNEIMECICYAEYLREYQSFLNGMELGYHLEKIIPGEEKVIMDIDFDEDGKDFEVLPDRKKSIFKKIFRKK